MKRQRGPRLGRIAWFGARQAQSESPDSHTSVASFDDSDEQALDPKPSTNPRSVDSPAPSNGPNGSVPQHALVAEDDPLAVGAQHTEPASCPVPRYPP
jgi:hypothetical protein